VTLDFGSTTTNAAFSDPDSFRLNGREEALATVFKPLQPFSKPKRIDVSQSIRRTISQPQRIWSSAAGASAFVGTLAALVGDTEAPIEFGSNEM
jgi:mevalonate pyrophosphate decarboxylase